ncbi:hypothetical protein E2C01_073186 [Portunus trituberculatus]|uniref:Uncharacterized protein n=1 Tax=Portunus trituberculatus TaxID=210409 RepID=A0A5B7I4I9_PORTR|nr:hypothetical protein [Portunus trituberculatus]
MSDQGLACAFVAGLPEDVRQRCATLCNVLQHDTWTMLLEQLVSTDARHFTPSTYTITFGSTSFNGGWERRLALMPPLQACFRLGTTN